MTTVKKTISGKPQLYLEQTASVQAPLTLDMTTNDTKERRDTQHIFINITSISRQENHKILIQ